MNKTFVIIKREYTTRVHTKGFIIGTILTPLLMLAMVLVPGLLAMRGASSDRRITILDQSGDPLLIEAIKRRAEGEPRDNELSSVDGRLARFSITHVPVPADKNIDEVRTDYNLKAESDPDFAYIVLRQRVLDDASPEYYSRSLSSFSMDNIERTVGSAIVERRLVRAGLDPAKVNSYTRRVEMKTKKIGPTGETDEEAFMGFLIPYFMLFFIYITIFMYGITVMRGVIEEKQSRIVEVIVSSVKPMQMMMGKLIGIGLVGLTQVVIWALSFMLIAAFGASLFGASASSLSKIPPSLALYFVVFYVLGYFLYATLYAIVGAIVSTEEEAQQAQMPVTLLIVAPMFLFTMIMSNPNSSSSIAFSLVPFFTPTLMMMRIAIVNPPLWQVLLSIVLMVAAILGAVWVAAKIYRVGILMYGKRPSIAELGRWLRYS
jgi:ABC-2 type transport system permease protein